MNIGDFRILLDTIPSAGKDEIGSTIEIKVVEYGHSPPSFSHCSVFVLCTSYAILLWLATDVKALWLTCIEAIWQVPMQNYLGRGMRFNRSVEYS